MIEYNSHYAARRASSRYFSGMLEDNYCDTKCRESTRAVTCPGPRGPRDRWLRLIDVVVEKINGKLGTLAAQAFLSGTSGSICLSTVKQFRQSMLCHNYRDEKSHELNIWTRGRVHRRGRGQLRPVGIANCEHVPSYATDSHDSRSGGDN